MATFKYEIFKDRKRIDGTYNVKIRVTHNRKLKRIPTSIYVTKEDITKGFKIKNQSILDELNNIISIYRSKCNLLSLLINDMDITELVEHITKTDESSLKIDFISYARKWIDENSIIRKSKFPQNPKRSVRFSGKGTKRSVQKRKARNTQKAETKVL